MERKHWQLLLIVGLIACFGVSNADAVKPDTVAVEGLFNGLTPNGFEFITTEYGTIDVVETAATKYKGFDDLYDLVEGNLLLVKGVEDGDTIVADRIELLDEGETPEPEPPMPIDMYWLTGTMEDFEAWEMVDFWYWWNEEQDEWVIRYLPAAEPKVLKIMTATEYSFYEDPEDDDDLPEWEVNIGEKHILDYGPDWFMASECLTDSYVCPCKPASMSPCPVNIGPFDLGTFMCTGPLVESVLSTDYNQYPDGGEYIELMTGIQLDNLYLDYADGSGNTAYAYGRTGGSEIVWLFECTQERFDAGECAEVGEFYLLTDLYTTLSGGNIVWEMRLPVDDANANVWWRGEGAPYAKVSDLGCTIIE